MAMSSASTEFWLENEEYHDLARTFEENVEIRTPSGFFECDLNGFSGHCPFCATSVTYYEYTGPSV